MTEHARDDMLRRIRRHALVALPRPEEDGPWITYEDPMAQFRQVLESVGGQSQVVDSLATAAQVLAQLPACVEGTRRLCLVPELDGPWTVQLDQVDDPHTLGDLDFAVFPGQFAVAENGAIWVTDRQVSQRTSYFIAQHLAIVLPADQIVDNLHQAYERLTFADNGFGCFVSGPSKTADIEQSLVIGAHGARSLTVLLVQAC